MKILSLFDGIACGYEALERAGIKIDRYVAYEIDKNAIAIAKKNHPDIEEMGSVVDADFTQYKGFDMVIGGSPCFCAGTLINTNHGMVPIENIQIGDEVLTHIGVYREVLNFMEHKAKGIYTIQVQGCYKTEVTGNHRFYVRDKARKWNNETRSYYMVYSEPYWKAVQDFNGNELILMPKNNETENFHNLTDDEIWLIGRYVADGYLQMYQRKNRILPMMRTAFCIGKGKDKEFRKHINGFTFHADTSKPSVTKYIITNNRIFFLCSQCGDISYEKHIPQWILNLPKDKLEIFLNGYMSGDGYQRKGGDVFKASSVSKILIYQINQCVNKIYNMSGSIMFTKRPKTTVIEGRTVNQRDDWQIQFSKSRNERTKSRFIDGEVWVPVKKITYEADRYETVYNMEVAIDNSYTANNMAVHNCQGFSVAGKQLNFDDPRSKLYFEFERAVREVEPTYFFLENVAMRKDFEAIITERLGVEPIAINSNLVSAQNRKRLYWTNIKGVTLPEDKGIVLADIVHENEPGFDGDLEPYKVPFDKTLQILDKEVQKGKIGYFRKDSQANRVYSIHGKAVTLCGEAGGGAAKMGQYLFGCITPDRVNKRQNGQRFNDGEKFYTLTAQDKHGVLIDGYIRKLTPVECERLQTLPDNYTQCDGVSEAARYKALGNGWTCDVIAHVFSNIKGE